MRPAWLVEDDGTVWPCQVQGPGLFRTLRVVDRTGALRTVLAERVRANDNIDLPWRSS